MLNPDKSSAVFDNKGRLVLQKNQIFVLGDNRAYSIDSSVEGPFSLDSVVGRVDFVVVLTLRFWLLRIDGKEFSR
jgi:type IV secretory pathway protease TraF